MSEIEPAWHPVAVLAELPEGRPHEVAVGGRLLLLLRDGEAVRAFQGLCPHQFARLAEGSVADGWLQCPRHLARFSLADGRCGPGWALPPLRRFQVRVEDGTVLLSDPPLAFG